ncbi:hypothetical protein FSP39_014818 [Pinctada imbricata]|uniref:Major facilitator superfamily (MFS) profile domain-containing protein n=1 Tax=Pinctada imbricata TaxID=66713 RepID=A0AA88XZF1_PINIB|nr:hypothetical protein FSP39_014818 [Pinctada imbricata]
MSVAIVCMVNSTAIQSKSTNSTAKSTGNAECGLIPADANATVSQAFEDGEFVWDKTIQGLILGSFFWGYLVTQIPGGWIATKFGGKKVYGLSMLVACVATFVTPIAAETSYVFLMVLRIILGICSGTCFPAMHALWGNWAPPLERSKLTAFTYAGAQVGNVITFPLAAMLCKYGFAGGWPSIFYILGFEGSMVQHYEVFAGVRHYRYENGVHDITNILSCITMNSVDLKVPWCSIMKSLPVYAIIISNMTSDWGAYTLLTNIPSYLKEVLQLDITSVSIIQG